jgi:CbiX
MVRLQVIVLIVTTALSSRRGVHSYVTVSTKSTRPFLTGVNSRWIRNKAVTTIVVRRLQALDVDDENVLQQSTLSDSSSLAVDEVEPDLFDYFDPLLSPHAYPKGIDATIRPNNEFTSLVRFSDDEDTEEGESTTSASIASETLLSIQNKDDLGWANTRRESSDLKKKYQLKKPFGISLPGSDIDEKESDRASILQKEVSSITTERPLVDVSTIFDPTISPHFYNKGPVPDVIVGDERDNNRTDFHNTQEVVKVGILLMDHGSRNAASNERLHDLAELYQEQFVRASKLTSRNVQVIVKAAHMEIASPSIQDGLSALMQENVQEIICHPYFLSPGRHVVEDIPLLVANAIKALSISIPVKTTRPIGSETTIMIQAMNALVAETSEYLS